MQILESYPIVFDLPKFRFVNFNDNWIPVLIQTTEWSSIGDDCRGANFPKKTIQVHYSV